MPQGLPFQLNDYLELVNWWTGGLEWRHYTRGQKGAIPVHLPDILRRLDMDVKQFTYLAQNFEHPFKNLVGAAQHVRKACEAIGQNWVHSMSQCEKSFSSS